MNPFPPGDHIIVTLDTDDMPDVAYKAPPAVVTIPRCCDDPILDIFPGKFSSEPRPGAYVTRAVLFCSHCDRELGYMEWERSG